LLTVVVLAVVALFPLQPAWQQVLLLAAIWASSAVALNLWQGYTGEISFGHAAFAAVGAYVGALLFTKAGLPLALAVLSALLASAAVAALVGWALVQLSHFGSAIVTFFLAFVVVALLGSGTLRGVTGGENGVLIPSAQIGGLDLLDTGTLVFVALACLTVTVLLTSNYASGRAGRALLLVKRSETVAGTMGVDVRRVKLTAFIFTAIFGAVSGILLTLAFGYLTPGLFDTTASVNLVAMVVVGGTGRIVGPILGAVFFTALPVAVQGAGEQQAVFGAVIFLLFLVFLPTGLAGLPRELPRALRHGRVKRAETSTAALVPQPRPTAELLDMHRVDPPALTIEGLEVRFGKLAALSGVSLRVEPRSIHAIVGANGAGKSTLLNVLSGVQKPTAGSCRLGDTELAGLSPQRMRALGLARTFQHPSHVADLSALANVSLGLYASRRWSLARDLLGARARRRGEEELVRRSTAALHLVGLPVHRHGVPAGDLSLAETRLVDIARALVDDASFVLLDEPTAGLAEDEMDILRTALVRVHEARGMSIVVVAHHLEFLREIADHLTVLDSGVVLADGIPEEVLRRPQVLEAFLGRTPAGVME
jgi:branched-chain amino acid transport system permease protein